MVYIEMSDKIISPQQRILVYLGNEILPIDVSDILLVFSDNNYRFLRTGETVYHVPYTLDKLEQMLGIDYYRINRKYLIPFKSIERIYFRDESKILVELKSPLNNTITVSRRKSNNFRKWLESPENVME